MGRRAKQSAQAAPSNNAQFSDTDSSGNDDGDQLQVAENYRLSSSDQIQIIKDEPAS